MASSILIIYFLNVKLSPQKIKEHNFVKEIKLSYNILWKKKLKWKFQNKINISHQNVEFAMILHIELNSKWKLNSFKIIKKINSNHQIRQYLIGLEKKSKPTWKLIILNIEKISPFVPFSLVWYNFPKPTKPSYFTFNC